MANLNDFCECICSVFQRSMETVEGILQSVSGQQYITGTGGYSSPDAAFGLTPPPSTTPSLSNTSLLTLTFVALFIMFILSMRRSLGTPDVTVTKPHDRGTGSDRSSGPGIH